MRALVVLGLSCIATAAIADPVIDVAVETHVDVRVDGVVAAEPPPPPPPPSPPRAPLARGHWEAGLAMAFVLGDVDLGGHAVAGRQVGQVRLAAEYSIAPFDACGQVNRLGASARYRLAAGMDVVGGGFFAEVGLGHQDRRWSDGRMPETRRDAMVGFGFEMLGGASGLIGFDVGARVTVANGATDTDPSELTGSILIGFLVGV